MKAVFLDRGSFPESAKISFPDWITVTESYHNSTEEEVYDRIADADIVMTNKVPLTRRHLESAQKLKLVQVLATGVNNVDVSACKALDIGVRNVAGYSTESVPEHTFALILELRRNISRYREDVKLGRWSESEFFCFMDHSIDDIAHNTITIIGKGALGSRVAKIAEGFGMSVLYAEHKGISEVRTGYTEFEEAIQRADIISLHCPLTDTTKNTIDSYEFELMKRTALLINTGRGGLVNEMALCNALKTGRIAGAGFDVASIEPMPMDHPLQELTRLPNFILTPHVAWASSNAISRLLDLANQSIQAFFEHDNK